jgi:acyl transferase domain-containing protein
MDDIAIVGVGCRFSGNANDPQQFWKLLEDGKSTWSEIPGSRFNVPGFYHPDPERKGAVSTLPSSSIEPN